MKSNNPLGVRRKGQPAAEPDPGTGPNLASESGETLPHQAAQAARAIMHPDRDDVEWRYWRSGWGRLTE
jgi:hypothetical protein